jgi:hypothetical protein
VVISKGRRLPKTSATRKELGMSERTDSAGADATGPTGSANADADADAEVDAEADATEPTDPDAHGGPTLSALAEEAASEAPRDEER